MADELILASASKIRQQMLSNANVEFKTEVARIDEHSVKSSLIAEQVKPRDIADALAELKALRVSGKFPESWVIGSDQVLEIDGELLSKPATINEARAQLCALRGKKHKLISSAVIAKGGVVKWRHIGEVRLYMRPFSDQYLEDYLARIGEDVLTTVGGYKLEEEGIRLFSRIEGDYFTVLGMPLLEVLTYLSDTGVIEK